MTNKFIEIGQGPAVVATDVDNVKNKLGYTHPDLHRYVNQQTELLDTDKLTIVLKDRTASKAVCNAQDHRPIYFMNVGKYSVPSTISTLLNSSVDYYLMEYHPELAMWSVSIPYNYFQLDLNDLNLYFVRYDTEANNIRNSWHANHFVYGYTGAIADSDPATDTANWTANIQKQIPWRSIVYVISDSETNPSQFDAHWDYLVSEPVSVRTVYFSNNRNWSNLYLYYWPIRSNNDGYPFWPGKQMKFVGYNSFNEAVYSADIPSFDIGMVFNVGSNQTQTVDIAYYSSDANNNIYLSGSQSTDGRWEIGKTILDPNSLTASFNLFKDTSSRVITEAAYRDTPKTYMIGIHNNHSYRTVDYHVHDEESITCEIP